MMRNKNWEIVGSYLFRRILQDGSDSRFDKIKTNPKRFFVAFMMQATWVSLCLMPVMAVNAVPAAAAAASGIVAGSKVKLTDVLGLSMYLGGLTLEVVADRQKARWVRERREKVHDEQFLTRGLWSRR
jgi:steroid 5-alpha reductase family enzyme